ncbi:mitochondrial carrier protein [Xylona heveae TC161]|uniref:Mitochondrial carrier protein n=1 Tax=Xylona heveae (strain CBS 132557 / TC161) TaxID=1328760 RepID=A0A165G7W2_XYLHT|nr:mitochondrial carrier protein [Xylona heveae TC161]KZF21842.1 mitochondrial carrier protein [Xylona heveae TC161]
MSADFWAGYISGAAGIIIGNPLDLVKVRQQAGSTAAASSEFESLGAFWRGITAPVLGYGALNALLFVSYNRTLLTLGDDPSQPSSAWKIWCAGAVGGFGTWVVSAPTELIKCRAQISSGEHSSWTIARNIWTQHGLRGLYLGGVVTSIRDAMGYGFYFWSYELTKQWLTRSPETPQQQAVRVFLAGGIAGIVTWASIFPLDVIKTRMQTQTSPLSPANLPTTEESTLLRNGGGSSGQEPRIRQGAIAIAKELYASEGIRAFFRGLPTCSVRAFIVNAVQFEVYELIMQYLKPAQPQPGVFMI